MIHPESMVKCVLIENEISYETTIHELFSRFSRYIKHHMDGSKTIIFKDENHSNINIKIQDMFGYSTILAIRQFPVDGKFNNTKWVELMGGNNHIWLSDETSIPIYDLRKDSYIGFHGEVKRDYILKSIAKINESVDCIRVKHDDIDKYVPARFCEIHNIPRYAYEIYTSSRFCSVNDIYIHTSDHITMDEINKMGDINKKK